MFYSSLKGSCTAYYCLGSIGLETFLYCMNTGGAASGVSSEAEQAAAGQTISLPSSREESPIDLERAEGAGQAGPSGGASAELAGPSNSARTIRRPRTSRRRQGRAVTGGGLDGLSGVPGPSGVPGRDRIWEPPRSRDLAYLAGGANPAQENGDHHCAVLWQA